MTLRNQIDRISFIFCKPADLQRKVTIAEGIAESHRWHNKALIRENALARKRIKELELQVDRMKQLIEDIGGRPYYE